MSFHKTRNGISLLMSIIVLAVISAWAVSISSMSGVNIQLAENQRKADGARACAESGHEIIRYWVNRFSVPGTTDYGLVFGELAASLSADLAANGISNITVYSDASHITVSPVTLDTAKSQSFSAVIEQVDSDTLKVSVTGVYGPVTKTVCVNYNYGVKANTVFDYGVATKGPLSLSGNVDLGGGNVSVESSVFIESENSLLALTISGSSKVTGNVRIANSLATVDLQGDKASIGGETGQAAIDHHVSFGVEPPEFPTPDPTRYEHYATNIVDSSTDTTADAVYDNIRIVAGTNPSFTGNVTLRGIIFVETPNVVSFAGGTTITGIIVGDGDLSDDSGTNRIEITGNVTSYSVSELPAEEQFAGLEDETGTFILAPGFHLSFGGNFTALSGAVAGNGVEFSGNAGGKVQGTIINYSDESMSLSGNSDLSFNRSGTDKVPAGFVPDIVLRYDSGSYSETLL